MSDRRVIMVTDARIGTDYQGKPAAADKALSGTSWKRGLEMVPNLELAVRVDPRPNSGNCEIDGVVHPLPFYVGMRQLIRVMPRLIKSLNSLVRQADVVVTRLPGVIGMLTAGLTKLHRKPLALEVVGDVEDALLQGSPNWARQAIAKIANQLTAHLVRRADSVRYVTRSTLQAKYPAARNARTVAFSSVILDGWNRAVRVPKSPVPTVLAIGSQEQLYKGHDLLIRCMPGLLGLMPDAMLVLVGEGREQATLRRLAAQLAVEEGVLFKGYVADRNLLIDLVDQAWIFTMPSRTEGLPRALVEAMARGLPCVGARVGGIPELLSPQQLVPVESVSELEARLAEQLLDPVLRTSLGELNKAEAKYFDPSALALHARDWSKSVNGLAGPK